MTSTHSRKTLDRLRVDMHEALADYQQAQTDPNLSKDQRDRIAERWYRATDLYVARRDFRDAE